MIHFDNVEHGRAIADRASCSFNPEVDKIISREEGGKLLGGVIYQDFTGACVSMHFAGFCAHWINRDMLWVCFHYPFVQLGYPKVIGGIRSSNLKSLEVAAKLGFKEAAKIRNVYPDGDAVFVEMDRENCRWLAIQPRHIRNAVGTI